MVTNLSDGRHGKLGSQRRRGVHHLLYLIIKRLVLLIRLPAVSRYKSIHRNGREVEVRGCVSMRERASWCPLRFATRPQVGIGGCKSTAGKAHGDKFRGEIGWIRGGLMV